MGLGPDGVRRLMVATADPGTLPDKATWYLVTNLPRPGSPRQAHSPHPEAGLAEIVRLYSIRNWIEYTRAPARDEYPRSIPAPKLAGPLATYHQK